MTQPASLHNFEPNQFPFRIRILDAGTDEVMWEHVVRGVGAVTIPGYAPRVVKVEVTFPDGKQFIEEPGQEQEVRFVRPLPRF